MKIEKYIMRVCAVVLFFAAASLQISSAQASLNPMALALDKDGLGIIMQDDEGNNQFVPNATLSQNLKQQYGVDLNGILQMIMPQDFVLQDFLSSTFDSNGYVSKHILGIAVNIPEQIANAMKTTAGNYMMVLMASLEHPTYYSMSMIIDVTTQNISTAGVSVDGAKIYLTGEIENAFPGNNNTQGFIHIEGDSAEIVDIYLENFRIKSIKPKEIEVANISSLLAGVFPNGSAISICTKTSAADKFVANFHIKGENMVVGGAERQIMFGQATGLEEMINSVLAGLLNASSAPITICPVADASEGQEGFASRTAKITFDDIWEGEHTNGLLDLPVKGKYGTPSIDLGNRYGQCEFNGGRYYLHCPASEANNMFYVSSMAICYRLTEIKLSGDVGLRFFGIGSSLSWGKDDQQDHNNENDVVINDGTFYVHPTTDYMNEPDQVDVVARGWYNEYTDLRLPYNTQINGGSFVGTRVYRCSSGTDLGVEPQDEDKNVLCYKQIHVDDANIDSSTGLMTKKLDEYPNYGCSSVTPENNNIYIYVKSADCEKKTPIYMRNWITVIPKMGAFDFTFGGDVHVNYYAGDTHEPIKNGYLFYANLGEYTKEYGSPNFPFLEQLGGALGGNADRITIGNAIKLPSEKCEFSDVSSDENSDYDIEYGLYMMRTYETNTWYMLSMPYDVANIYVLETLPEIETLPDSVKNDHEKYLQAQGKADSNLAMTIVTSLCPDILSGNGSGVRKNLVEIINDQLKYDDGSPVNLRPIYHYNPNYWGEKNAGNHSAAKASFYLYEMDSINTEGSAADSPEADVYFPTGYATWNMGDNSAKGYSRKWKYATNRQKSADEDNEIRLDNDYDVRYKTENYKDREGNAVTLDEGIVMQRGVTYALYLPDGAKRYWDGKYLIFEGYGPQRITGKGNYFPLRATTDEEYTRVAYKDAVGLQANVTFRNDTIPDDQFIFRTAHDSNTPFHFERVKGADIDYRKYDQNGANRPILPGEVYAVLSYEATKETDSNGNYLINEIGATQSNVNLPQLKKETTNSNSVVDLRLGSSLVAWSDKGIKLHSFAEQELKIYNLNGQCIFSENLHDGDNRYVKVPVGVYVICGNEVVKKLVVE